jgi:stage III sporulation protein SpoIIIAA
MNDIDLLLAVLPPELRGDVEPDRLLEIVADIGRPLEFRYPEGSTYITDVIVDEAFLKQSLSSVTQFGPDNRAGINGTLHRISKIVDRQSRPVGLTCRVGRPMLGTITIIEDLIAAGSNILIIGAPGVGKSTKLRDVARLLSTDKLRRVVIVDTSNEIAGDGAVPHAAVGKARRLQVPFGRNQADVMIEAVENHTPEVIIVDEISTIAETNACRTIAQRGVQLIATAHGRVLSDVIKNPPLVKLIGGIQTVTLGDEQAKLRGTSKTVSERESEPVFSVVVEIESFDRVSVHTDISAAVDAYLRGAVVTPETRILTGDGRVITEQKGAITAPAPVNDIEDQYNASDYVKPIREREFVRKPRTNRRRR